MTRAPIQTYRLQLGPHLSFAAARELVPYLSRLGITHLYLSPCLAARPGSTHGYDITDHRRLSAELGGDAEFEPLAREAESHGLGLVLDFVPNHMGVDAGSNPWWRDVLENGECSAYARCFDIDWRPLKPELRDKVLLPILGDLYGLVLERGELRLEIRDGALALRYFDHDLPVNPRQAPRVLRLGLDEAAASRSPDDPDLAEYHSILTALAHLPAIEETDPARIAERRREKEIARERLVRLFERAPWARELAENAIRVVNGVPGVPESFDRLHELLEVQPYRLAYWRTAIHEINYRRFFDVNDLGALRMEDPEVFAASHELVLRLLREGKLAGLRLDHVDGLLDPAAYLERLAAETGGAWTVVEKILGDEERLPADWKVAGTTGYDFLNDVNGLFVDRRGERRLKAAYDRFTGELLSFEALAAEGKRFVMQTSLASELAVLAHRLNRISERSRRSRDFTLDSLRDAIRAVIAVFPVYRTYVSPRGASASDREVIDRAVEAAKERNPTLEDSIFDFVRDALLPDPAALPEAEVRERIEFAMRFQQLASAVQAKGIEDTAFYRQAVLASLNEVGGEPARFGRSPGEFHAANRLRAEHHPHGMLATATHDTKRGEDARTRIDAISEIAGEWTQAVGRFAKLHARHRTRRGRETAPDPRDEWLFYQTLVATLPPGGGELAAADLESRLVEYLRKAIREAKLRTSWVNPNPEYEAAIERFVAGVLRGETAPRFLERLRPIAARLARLGATSSLAHTVLKIGSPGVVDVYQGTELWDLSLVDPDNRRPVDFGLRERRLAEMEPLLSSETPDRDALGGLLRDWPDGRIKLYVLARGLRLRARHPAAFVGGDYRPIALEGARAAHAVAFARSGGGTDAVVLAPRLVAAFTGEDRPFPTGEAAWLDTAIVLPEELGTVGWRDELSGFRPTVRSGRIELANVLDPLPVALLVRTR